MTDKNLTDNKITINALKELLEVMLCEGDLQRVSTISHTIDLINRLQAEIERLKNAYKQCAWERDVFAEDMTQEIKKDCSYLMLDIKTIKAEAYKECIEKAKNEIDTQSHSRSLEASGERFRIHKILNNLLKEMEGK